MKNLPRKRRTRAHVIADLSVNHVERHALLGGHVIQRMIHDYGIDLELFTFNKKGEAEEGVIFFQVKASDRFHIRSGQEAFSFRIERIDLVLWLAQPMPVILIVYDAAKDNAYWVYIQRYFRELGGFNLFSAGKTITLHVSTANILNATAIRRFAGFRNQVLRKIAEVSHDDDEDDIVR